MSITQYKHEGYIMEFYKKITRKVLLAVLFIAWGSILQLSAVEKQKIEKKNYLITNVKVFDGYTKTLKSGPVLIEGNRIKAVGSNAKKMDNMNVIDGSGGILMPGLIDAHWHAMMSNIALNTAMTADIGYINHVAAEGVSQTLARGFTTVRDAGGPTFGLKRAIDEKVIKGPRIYPSGAIISQTSGHGDFRPATAVPENSATPLSYMEREGFFILADGVPQVLKRTREVLRQGASQLKVMAGGGVASDFDPLDVTHNILMKS